MAGAILEVKYFNTFLLKKVNKSNRIIWNGSFGIPRDIGGYPVLPKSDTGGINTWAIEESRIRGGYNNTTVDFGAKAYIVEEESLGTRRFNTIIYSGIFNSRTGINQTNVFSVGEDITKSVDPANGSIQKLYAEDTNLNVFQELKVSRALIDKDAIYSAEGGGTVTSSNLVIGAIQPYAGKYGISKNPESFAVYGNRKYFADTNNNVILRLGNSGIDEISAYGMKDYFRDRLNNINNAYSNGVILGAWDIHNKEYVVSMQANGIETYFDTLSFDEQAKGWVSQYSYEPDQIFSLRNEFYSVKTVGENAFAVTTGVETTPQPQSVFQLLPGSINGNITPGSVATACFITPCTPESFITLGNVVSFDPDTNTVVLDNERVYSNNVKMFFGSGAVLYRHYSQSVNRANFYGVDNDSSVTFIFNPQATNSKTFKTLAYEGSDGWECPEFVSFFSTKDTIQQIPSYGEGEYALVQGQGTTSAASTTVNVTLRTNISNNIVNRAEVEGPGVIPGTTVESYNPATGDLVLSQPASLNINTTIYFSAYVAPPDYLSVFGTSNPGIDRYYSGFYRKEGKYVANLINNSGPNSQEVNFGDNMTGVKGFYSLVTLQTDKTTDYGRNKTIFSVESEYNLSNGY